VPIQFRKIAVDHRKYFTKQDAFLLFELPALFLLSWLVPERRWRWACYRLEQLKARLGISSPQPIAEKAEKVLPETTREYDWWKFALLNNTSRSEHHVQVFREHRPGAWSPQIILKGEEHLHRAQQSGKGAILWRAHFAFASLAANKAFLDAGINVWHLSRPEHGFSKSGFGIKYFNPIRVSAESKYLAGRVLINRADPEVAKRRAAEILYGNGFISITAGAWEGRSIARVKLLGGTIDLATGAPNFAQKHGADLLPVFVYRDEDTCAFNVVVDAPIVAPDSKEKNCST